MMRYNFVLRTTAGGAPAAAAGGVLVGGVLPRGAALAGLSWRRRLGGEMGAGAGAAAWVAWVARRPRTRFRIPWAC